MITEHAKNRIMDDNERLRQIMSKMKEIEEIAKITDKDRCDPALTTETANKAWSLYLSLRPTGRHKTDLGRIARTYEYIDQAYVEIMDYDYDQANAYQINHEAARRIALLMPKLQKALSRMNIYPMEESAIAEDVYRRRLEEKEQDDQDPPVGAKP